MEYYLGCHVAFGFLVAHIIFRMIVNILLLWSIILRDDACMMFLVAYHDIAMGLVVLLFLDSGCSQYFVILGVYDTSILFSGLCVGYCYDLDYKWIYDIGVSLKLWG